MWWFLYLPEDKQIIFCVESFLFVMLFDGDFYESLNICFLYILSINISVTWWFMFIFFSCWLLQLGSVLFVLTVLFKNYLCILHLIALRRRHQWLFWHICCSFYTCWRNKQDSVYSSMWWWLTRAWWNFYFSFNITGKSFSPTLP